MFLDRVVLRNALSDEPPRDAIGAEEVDLRIRDDQRGIGGVKGQGGRDRLRLGVCGCGFDPWSCLGYRSGRAAKAATRTERKLRANIS